MHSRAGLLIALTGLAASQVCGSGTEGAGRAETRIRWDRVMTEIGRYKAATDTSGFVEVERFIDPRLDTTDLQAICRAKREAPRRASLARSQVLP